MATKLATKRRLYILSDAGKPIWTSTDEPESTLAPLMGVVTAVLGFASSRKDSLKAVQMKGGTKVVVIVRGAVVLLAVSPFDETEVYLACLLETLYHQILFTLTSMVQRKLAASAGFDLRNLLGGTEPVLRALATRNGLCDPGLLTQAVRCLPVALATRMEAGRVLSMTKAQVGPELLYGILLVGDRLLSLLQPKEPVAHRLHPADLRLIVNFVSSQKKALKGTESWTPLCLPRFNASGNLSSYIGYVDETSDLCLLLVSASSSPDTFLVFQQWRGAVRGALERGGHLEVIRHAHASAFQSKGGDDGRYLHAGPEPLHPNQAAQLAAQQASPMPSSAYPSSHSHNNTTTTTNNNNNTAGVTAAGAAGGLAVTPSQLAHAHAQAASAHASALQAQLVHAQHLLLKPLHFLYVHKSGGGGAGGPAAAKHEGNRAAASAASGSGSRSGSSSGVLSQGGSGCSSSSGSGGGGGGGGGSGKKSDDPCLPQYLCPARFCFPHDTSDDASMVVWVAYQRSILRLRQCSSKAEATLPPSEVKGDPNTGKGTEAAVASSVWEQPPCNDVAITSGAAGLVLGLASADFELHALFPPTVLAADALAAAQRLISRIRKDAGVLFMGKLPTY